MAINIMLVDDHTLFREGIKSLLDKYDKYNVISQAANGMECLSLLDNISPDIILLDINMPSINGLDVIAEIKKKYNSIKIIMVTSHREQEYFFNSLDFGADGYIVKDADTSELFLAIDTVFSGEQYIQKDLTSIMENRKINRDVDKEKIDNLTKREIEILKQIAGGRFNKEIADDLDITERTVKNHISNLFKKIDVNDRTQAAVFAIRNNLVNLY